MRVPWIDHGRVYQKEAVKAPVTLSLLVCFFPAAAIMDESYFSEYKPPMEPWLMHPPAAETPAPGITDVCWPWEASIEELEKKADTIQESV